ncbi:MAG: hypothetical protein JSR55_12585 [Proteobacteria bacterium]|nr:hypothetical protein [Pseudomonadota bacterium]
MMPVIRINDATFANLKSLSTWLGTKTPSETFDRIVSDAMEQLGMERDDEPNAAAAGNGATEFESTPGLAFTKPLSATINGKSIQNPRWSAIMLSMVAEVKAKGFEGENLVRELNIPAKAAKYEEEGFRYYPELGISVQGQSASDAWEEAQRLSRKWRIPLTVEFQWRQNPKAQFPGRTGILRSGR